MAMIHGYRNIDESGCGVDAWHNALHGGGHDGGKYVVDIYVDDGRGAFKAVSAMEETYEGMLECLRDNAVRLSRRWDSRPLEEAVRWAQGMLLALHGGSRKEHELDYCEYGGDGDIYGDADDDLYDDLYDDLDGYGGELVE